MPKHRKNSGSRRRATRRGQRDGWSLAQKIGVIWAALVMVVGVGLGANQMIETDGADLAYCYERPNQPVSVVFLDNSLTDLSSPQLRDYRAAFMRSYEQAAPNTRVLVFSTAADVQGSLVTPVFEICKPPSSEAELASIGAPSKAAPYLSRRAAEAQSMFVAAVDRILVDAQDPAKLSGDSPILEQLQSISRLEVFQVMNRRLSVITDGLQNSETARFCAVQGNMPPYPTFEGSAAYKGIAPRSFSGAAISLFLVESANLPQPGLEHCTHAELQQWWQDYFRGNGGQELEMTRLRFWAGS